MAPAPLRELQRALRALIAAPGGDEARRDPARDGAPAAERADGDGDAAARLGVRGDDRLSPRERVAIYAGMYAARLHDAVAEDYPALRAALGDARFAALVRAYVARHPPSDASLRRAADRLADFVAASATAEPWLADLARFEAAMVAAFDAADEPVLSPGGLAALAPERWPSLEIRPVRSLVRLAPRFPVDELRRALLEGDPADALDAAEAAEPLRLRVWRQDLRVWFRRMPALEAEALALAAGGTPFAALCEGLAPRCGGDPPAEAAARLLQRWLEDGLLVDTRGAP